MTLTLKGEIRDLLGLEGNLMSGETEQPSRKYRGVFNHPDFEIDNSRHGHDRGIVHLNLGLDGTPEHVGTATRSTQGPSAFYSWYHDDPKFNRFHIHDIPLQSSVRPGVYVYENEEFFPLDTVSNTFGKQRNSDTHNYHFTYAVKAHEFTYTGKEEFFFRGDDDLWLFLNGKLVVDLGGTHEALEGRVNLQIADNEETFNKPLMDVSLLGPNHPLAKKVPNERLILQKGEKVRFDLFFAERHRTKSRFKIETSMVLAPPPLIVTIRATDPSAKEFPTDTGEFTVSLDRPADERLVVLYEVSGTAEQGSDYQKLQPIVFEKGEQAVSLVVTPERDDEATEGTETVIVTLKESGDRDRDSKYRVGTPRQATVEIEDYVPPPPIATIEATTPNAKEPQPQLSEAGINGEFRITLDKALKEPLAINYTVSGDAIPDEDYIALPKTVTIPAGATFVSLPVIPKADTQREDRETVIVTLTNAPQAQYQVGTARSATVTITDSPPPLIAGVRTTKSPALEAGEVPGEFEIFLDQPAFKDITLSYRLAGTAIEGVDYRPLATATILKGEKSVLLPVNPIDDSEIEPEETVILNLLDGEDYDLDPDASMATVTIISDDVPIPVVAIKATIPVAEEPQPPLGLPGSNGEFTITLDKALKEPLIIHYEVSGSATPNVDYIALSIPVTMPAGETTITLPVVPQSDTLREADEKVIVTLLDDPNGQYEVGPDRADMVTIKSPDPIIASVKATKPIAREKGGVPGEFTVTLNQPAPVDITVEYQRSGTATQGADYQPLAKAVIPKDEQSVAFPVVPVDDQIIENDETVILTLVDRANYDLDPSAQTATVTIISDDRPVATISASIPVAKEPQSQLGLPGRNGEFTITLDQPTQVPLTIHCQIGGNAIQGRDYVPLTIPVPIPAGQRSAKFPVVPKADRYTEGSETVVVSLVNDPQGRYAVGAARTATVTIQDSPPVVAQVRATKPIAREKGRVPGEFTVSLNQRAPIDITVDYQLTGTATQRTDYLPLARAVIPKGRQSVALPVVPVDDTIVENNETVILTLVDRTTYDLASSAKTATVTIISDDRPVATITASMPVAKEPQSQLGLLGRNGEFTITLDQPSKVPLTINYQVGGNAIQGTDYVPLTIPVSIPAGKRSVKLPVVPIADRHTEGNETVVVSLVNDAQGRYAVGAARTATVTIQDSPPVVARVRATKPTAREKGRVPGEFTVSLSQPAPVDLTVQYKLTGTAKPNDYKPLAAATFRRGMRDVILTVTPRIDQRKEDNETVVLTLINGANYDLDSNAKRAVVTIIDNPPVIPPVASIKATDPDAVEPEEGRAKRGKQGKFLIRLDQPAPRRLTIRYGIKGDATPGNNKDYLLTNKNGRKMGTAARNNTIVIPKGDRKVEVFVVPLADLDFRRQDENEDVVMQLLPGDGYTLPNQRKRKVAKVNIIDPGSGDKKEGDDRLKDRN